MKLSPRGHAARRILPGLLAAFAIALHGAALPESPLVRSNALAIVARHKGVFTSPPVLVPTRKVPDAPLLGNGDLGVVAAGVV